MKTKAVATIIVVALVAAGLWGARAYRATTAAPAPTVLTATVSRGDLRVSVSGTAPLAPAQVETVTAEVAGTVREIRIEAMAPVGAGQVVLMLGNDELRQQRQQAAADLAAEEWKLQRLYHPDPADIEAARLRVAQAEATLAARSADLAGLSVVAPVTGTTHAVEVVVGDDVVGSQVLLTLLEAAAPSVQLQVSPAAAAYVAPGQQVEVQLEGRAATHGRVTEVGAASAAGGAAAVTVTVALPADAPATPGATATATIFTGHPDYPAGVTAAGSVPLLRAAPVRAQAAGRVAAVHVAAGETVRAGQPLLDLGSDQAVVAAAQAEHDLRTARRHLAALLDPAADAERSLEVRLQESRVAQARLRLQDRDDDLARLTVTAPIAGTVTELLVGPGQRVTPGAALFTVEDHTTFALVIPVDELDIPRLSTGQTALVEADALAGRFFPGTLTHISHQGRVQDGVTTFDVTVAVPRPRLLLAGMHAMAEIIVAERQDVLVVPRGAVTMREGRTVVRRQLPDGGEEPVEVTVGMVADGAVEIVDGLAEGDEIVVGALAAQQAVQPGGGALPGMAVPGMRIPGGSFPGGGGGGRVIPAPGGGGGGR